MSRKIRTDLITSIIRPLLLRGERRLAWVELPVATERALSEGLTWNFAHLANTCRNADNHVNVTGVLYSTIRD